MQSVKHHSEPVISQGRADDRSFAIVLGAVCSLGLVLRALHLDIPMRYDESVTYLSYASRGWAHITTSYQEPNNHVFHSLLVSWLTTWLGDAPGIIRLPAFLAGCALIPAVAWVGHLAHGRAAGLIAAVLVATSPILIEFSTNARGYTLMSLCVLVAVGVGLRLLKDPGWIAWLALIELAVIGFYTLPIMAIPWLGIVLWLAGGLFKQGSTSGARARRLMPLVMATLAIGGLVLALYSEILLGGGLDTIVGNRFVEKEPLGTFLLEAPGAVAAVLLHWGRGVPPILAGLGLASIGAGLSLARGRREWVRLLSGLAVGAGIMMLIIRNWGEPRIWLWAVPLISITAAMGILEVSERVAQKRAAAASLAIATSWAVAMSLQVVLVQPVRASLETGAIPEVRDIVRGILEQYRLGDDVVGDFVTVEPVRYYLLRWAKSHEPSPRSALRRNWIILNGNDPARAEDVRRRVLGMGAPPLESSTPAFAVGNVDVYLFGELVSSPDARLIEAIAWHTGVAGRMDDERALALFFEVVEETDSALARMWMARCHAIGCLGFAPSDANARFLADQAIGEIREFAAAGEVEAVFLMGTANAHGLGGPIDSERATLWYRRAAESGHVLAARALGSAYLAGRGVEQNDSAAVVWWRRAAEAGDAVAQQRLGESYAAGRGVERDLVQATSWYTDSIERGNAEAEVGLKDLQGGPPS